MSITCLRQQGGAVGIKLNVKALGDRINIKPAGRIARGRESLTELLQGIDETEVRAFNEATVDALNSHSVGNEVI
ncbi:antitoxin [Photorhabdus sp. APURE]|uniref:antitoxin n=1 Tax=Photorhabdus aballayi TaxID=2991723 RepID=UPI00223DD071|nr:antitoxin [Photorhabdus aballayi]MCW7548648.1 antitoxin [Photorhabdus aballayi]